jgi:hypothetical protein
MESPSHSRSSRNQVKAFLDPVQRAQLVLAWARLERQVQDLIQQRMNQGVRRPQ